MHTLLRHAIRLAVRASPEPVRRRVARLPFSRFHAVSRACLRGDEVVVYRGAQVLVNPGELVGFYTFLFGDFSRHEVDLLIALSAGAKVLFDLGANIGLVSLAVARRWPALHVVALEPDPEVAKMFSANVLRNPDLVPRIQLRPEAVSDRDGVLGFRSSGGENLGAGQLVEREAGSSLVATRSLDSLCAELGLLPNVIKMDVEGSELSTLRGMRGVLASPALRAILVEVHGSFQKDPVAFHRELHSTLVAGGFSLHVVEERGVSPAPPPDVWPGRTHVLALRAGTPLPDLLRS